MNFKEAMEHYRSGTADETERDLVERELEKSQLIAEYLDAQWDEPWDEDGETLRSAMEREAETSDRELKTLRKRLWCRNAAVVLTSVVLAAVILLGVIHIGLPAAEKKYWNPEQNTYGHQFSTDLDLAFSAYTELFVEGKDIYQVVSERTGFAAYDLTLIYATPTDGSSRYAYGTLRKGELSLPRDVLQLGPLNIFERATVPEYPLSEENKKHIREKLQVLPEYMNVYAAVSFPEDLSMEELVQFEESLEDGHVGWVGIRNSEAGVQRLPLCGMKPYNGGLIRENINEAFPMFEIKTEKKTAENLEQHFRSLLLYSAVQAEGGTGVGGVLAAYYEEILNYTEEYGIYTYGCYITTTPKEVLRLLDSGVISQAWPMEAWVDL